MSDTTRLLCAAAYRDRKFASYVVDKVLKEELRGVAPSFGVDIVPVVRHCLVAQRRRLFVDTVLVLVLLAGGVMVLRGVDPINAGARVILLAWAVIFVADCLTRYQVLVDFFPDRFDPAAAPRPASRRQARLIAELARHENGNITVYSGFQPFVGAGLLSESWSFTIDLRKGREEFGEAREPREFEVDDLYDALAQGLRDLSIDGLDPHHRLFVNGEDIRREGWILPDPLHRPVSAVHPRLVREFLRAPTRKVRHYMVAQVQDWSGELIVTLFVRFSRSGACLVAEGVYGLLPPLREWYHQVDRLRPGADLRNAARMVARSVWMTPWLLVRAPFEIAGQALKPLADHLARRELRRQIRSDMRFDYGATTSIRQWAASTEYRRYFQKLDESAYEKMLDHAVLNAIVEFLDEHDIDTSDLKERQSVILNSGVIVSGRGSLQAGAMAVGARAKARTERSSK